MDSRTELIRFGEQLRQVCEKRGLSVAQVAARTGMGARRVARLEAGLSDPRYAGLRVLCRSLDVEPSMLVAAVDMGDQG